MGANNCPGDSEAAPTFLSNDFSVFTLEEAAARLRVCPKPLSHFLKHTPRPPPLCARVGRRHIISATDLARIYQEMKQCPSESSIAAKAQTSICAAPSAAS